MNEKNLTLDHGSVNSFVNSLWPNQEDGFFAVSWDMPNGALHTEWLKHPVNTGTLCKILRLIIKRNAWYSIGLFGKKPRRGRGAVKDVIGSPGFVLDVDCREGNHSKKNLPTKEEGLKFITTEIPYKPSFIVNSGGGYHAYYLFDEPWIFEDEEDKQRCIEMSSKWQGFVTSMGKENGWDLDNTGSIEHLFRIPGTFNHKGDPVRVEVIDHV
jgi:hypothetical protein